MILPVEPMLARLQRELPLGDYLYEPKWDGFRCLAVAHGELYSRHGKPLARYFPEITAALEALPAGSILDGELFCFEFAELLGRLHPSRSRVERLARETPATFVAFDLLDAGGEDVRQLPFAERRARLERLPFAHPLHLTPATDDPARAAIWLEGRERGIDGVVAKPRAGTYQPGRRVMVKVKKLRTVDCVVAGFRFYADERVVGSLLLGLWEGDDLRHVGVASSFPAARRRSLLVDLRPFVAPLGGHPWEGGFGLGPSPIGRLPGAASRWDPHEMEQDWVSLRPELVAEVTYDQLDGTRFRHAARFVRWRPDREGRSCALEQLG
jgi:ATP-dependent DNA ligase